MKIAIKPIDSRYKTGLWALPSYQTVGSAGVDLVAAINEPVALSPGDQVTIPTGLAISIGNPGIVAKIHPRSGLGSRGIVLGNLTGVIDSDYQGEIKVVLWRRPFSGDISLLGALMSGALADPVVISPGDRIAQMIFQTVVQAEWEVVDSFENPSERGENGFGSTGT